MKKGWLITFFVAFFCICALNFNNLAYAQINQSSSNTENEIGFKNQTPVEVLDILQRVSKYSEASQQEIEIISNYYAIDGSIFKDLETKGYDFITSAKIVDLNTKYNIDLKTIEEYIQQGKDLDSLYPQMEVNQDSSSITTEPNGSEYIKEIEAPKEIGEDYEEYVNPEDGSFNYKQEDLVLPGKNGLDLVIAPMYSSISTLVYYSYTYEEETYNEYVENKSGIFNGTGWSFGLPYADINGTDTYKNLTIHSLDGHSYEFEVNKDPNDNTPILPKDYNFSDIKLYTLWSYRDFLGYELVHKDGMKEIFSENGKIDRIEDRYSNKIKFNFYSEDTCYITDSMGREIQITNRESENGGKEVKINVPGKGTITYVFENNPEYKNFILKRKIDFLGRITEFCYRYDIAHTYERYGIDITNVYVHLEKIVHPNQSYTLNTYEIATKTAGRDGKKDEYYRVKSKELIDGSTSYDKCSYTYDGYSRDYLSCKYIISPVSGNEYFGFSTTKDNGRTKVTSIYNDDYLKSLYDTYHDYPYPPNITDYSEVSAEKMEELVYDYNNKLLIHKSYSYYKKKLIAGLTTTKYGTSLSDKISSTESFLYDDYKDLLEYTNELGNKTTYTYESQYHRKASEIDSSSSVGEKIEWSYDQYGEAITTHYREYNDLNNSSVKTHQVRNNRDAYGNVVSEIINDTVDKYYTYENNNYLSSIRTVVKDRNGKERTIEERLNYDPNTGDLLSYTDGNGNQTKYLYDSIGRLLRVTHPDNSYASLQYSNDDKSVVMTDELGVVTNITYNALGKIKSISAPKINERYEYDRFGRNISSYNGEIYTYYEYDCFDRIIKTTNPDVTTVGILYNDIQNYKEVTDERGRKHYSYYDLAGNITKETSPGGKNTINNYNSKGQLISTINANGFSTGYEYNCLGNIIRIVDMGGKPFVYQYDNNNPNIITNVYTTTGLISSKTYDELGRILSEEGIGNFKRYYEHDGAGNIIKETNPVSNTIILCTYDSRNRLLSKSIGSMSYTYTYDVVGNVISIANPQGIITYEYENGRIKRATLPNGKSISYQFDQRGRKIIMYDYYGKFTLYSYDNMDRLVKVYTDDGIGIYYSYYTDGQLRESVSEYGKEISRTGYLYDSDNNLIEVKNYYPNYQGYQYTYDALGNQLSKTDSNGTIKYSYDAYNRVETVLNPDGSKTSYGYDAYGNINRKVVTANDSSIISTADYVYNEFNRLDHIIEDKTQKLSKLLIAPEVVYALADQQISFTLTGFISYGIVINEKVLNEATWTVSSPTMTLNATKGKTVTGVISKAAWDAMAPTDVITVRAALQGKIVEAKVYKDTANTLILQNLSITPTEVYALADQQMTFTIAGTMNDGSVATDELLSAATWTVSSPTMTLNATKGKTVTGAISRADWDAMAPTDVITVTATLQEKVVEATIHKGVPVLQRLSITPREAYVLADQQITFTIAGTMNDGSAATDELLSAATWTVRALNPSTLTLNTNEGKTVTGVISKDAWDAMSSLDFISVRANLQGKTVLAQVYKKVENTPVLQSLSITPTETRALADQQINFTISGVMTDGSSVSDELLSTATWAVNSSKMTLNATQGKTITGVIPKSAWDGMSSTDIITVTATLQDKTISSFVYKYIANTAVLQSLSITPSSAVIMKGQSKTFTLTGLMSDGTAAPDSLLNGASWIASSVFTLGNNIGKTVTVYYGVAISSTNNSESNDIDSQNGITGIPIIKDLVASIGNITAEADISTGIASFSVENLIAYNENYIISSIDSSLNNEISSTPVDRTTTYFKYDNNGNMIEERVVKATGEEISTYRFDNFNQLVEVTNPQGTTAFTYYPSGLRETKRHGGEVTKFYYDGQNIILEEANNSLRARNIYGNGVVLAARENYDVAGNANNYFYIYNGHGDVVALVDKNCNIINDYEYDIYGETLQPNGTTVDNPFRYVGQYYDKETGLYYLRARYYDPELMRFVSEDTDKGDVKDPLSLNLYTYCKGNPIRYYDYTGNNDTTDPMGLTSGRNQLPMPPGGGELVLIIFDWLVKQGETVTNAFTISNFLVTYYYPTMVNMGQQTGLQYIDVSKASAMTEAYNINPYRWHKVNQTYNSFIKNLKKQKYKFKDLPSEDMIIKAVSDENGKLIYEIHELQPIYNPSGGKLSGMYYPIHYHLYDSKGKIVPGQHYYFSPV